MTSFVKLRWRWCLSAPVGGKVKGGYGNTRPATDTSTRQALPEFQRLGGTVESPSNRRFIVVTVPATAGFPIVEAMATSWTTDHGGDWEYGNVYDDDGNVLDWWMTK